MKEIIQIIAYTVFLIFEVIAAMILYFLIGGILASRQTRYEELVNSPVIFLVRNLFGDFLFSLILGAILTFFYWILKRFSLLPEGLTEKISTFAFFKWQVIILICFGVCTLVWVSYELLQIKPEM